jgi:hypothetical protein
MVNRKWPRPEKKDADEIVNGQPMENSGVVTRIGA